MKKIKFIIDTGFAGCTYEIVDEFEDDVTEDELEECLQDLIFQYVSGTWKETED